MALVWDKWVALKILEFLLCVACLVTKRISADDEVRLSLLLQKLSREWSLLTSVTWDSVGGAFADAVYGGYVIITFGLLLGRIVREIPRGRRILEGFLLGVGLLLFLVLGGLELASLDSVPHNLIVNASVLGAFSLAVAALFLLDLMGPRIYTKTNQSQTDPNTMFVSQDFKKVSASPPQMTDTVDGPIANGHLGNEKPNGHLPSEKSNGHLPSDKSNGHLPSDKSNGHLPSEKSNGHLPSERSNGHLPSERANGHLPSSKQTTLIANERPKHLDIEKNQDKLLKKDNSSVFDKPKHGYTKFDDNGLENEGLEKSKFGSFRDFEGGNYVRLSDPLAEPDRLHYEMELAKFNERYFREFLEATAVDGGRYIVREDYLPDPQTPQFAKVQSGRLKTLYDDVSPTYEKKRASKSPTRSPTRVKTVPSPTLQQLEDYLRSPSRSRRGDTPALFPMEPIEERDREPVEQDGRASGTPTDPGYVQYTADKWPEKRSIRTPRHSPTN